MVDIHNTSELNNILNKLQPNAKPLWGKMSPQHIIEHLAMAVKISTGRINSKFYSTVEEAEKIKSHVIHSQAELTQGIKNPILTDEPPTLVYPDLTTAISELHKEVDHFKSYYEKNKGAIHTQPRMGDLNHAEWLTLHNKHFTHHFKQYGLTE
ncbi:MAG: DUF1569 domain-containing protein [Bacteroidetes bacterium]|nr:DUF1569 domain-containing protein [Bacteroidota bacterium]